MPNLYRPLEELGTQTSDHGLASNVACFSADSQDFSTRSLVMIGAGLVAREDGQLALELVPHNTLRVIVDVPQDAISPLHECLFAIGELRNELPPEISSTTPN